MCNRLENDWLRHNPNWPNYLTAGINLFELSDKAAKKIKLMAEPTIDMRSRYLNLRGLPKHPSAVRYRLWLEGRRRDVVLSVNHRKQRCNSLLLSSHFDNKRPLA